MGLLNFFFFISESMFLLESDHPKSLLVFGVFTSTRYGPQPAAFPPECVSQKFPSFRRPLFTGFHTMLAALDVERFTALGGGC